MGTKRRISSYNHGSDNNNGFVVDDDDAPKRSFKKSKTRPGANQKPKPKTGDNNSKANKDRAKDNDGNPFWEIGGRNRRVVVSDFKGKTFVNIREYYEADGEMRPGKKGISLSVDQFAMFLSVLPEIEKALEGMGVEVPRPEYGERKDEVDNDAENLEGNEEEDSGDEEEEDHEDDDIAAGGGDGKKLNIEATSDEDEE